MTSSQRYLAWLLGNFNSTFSSLMMEWIRTGKAPAAARWLILADAARVVLEWTDLISMAQIRFEATGERILLPPIRGGRPPAIAMILGQNPTFEHHARTTHPIADWKAREWLKAEKHYGESLAIRRAMILAKKDLPGNLLAYRMRRFKRECMGEIANVAEEVTLANPLIGELFPLRLYLTRDDARVRPSHAAMHGMVCTGDWPGWAYVRPLAGWNCFLPGTTVQGAWLGGFKAWYDGPAVEIETAKGHRLRVTAKHPIMTPNGWVPAGKLNDGDALLSNDVPIDAAPRREVDDQQNPARVENVFESLAAHRVSGPSNVTLDDVSPLDFYGDAAFFDGKVQVVLSDLILSSHADAVASHGLMERNLVVADVGEPRLPSFGPLELNVDGVTLSRSGLPCLGTLLGDRKRIRLGGLPFDRLRGGSAANIHSSSNEGVTEGSAADPETLRETLHGLPGSVTTDKVRKVRKFDFSGHVYDFQTENGLILAQGIVTSNCRCYRRNITTREAEKKGWMRGGKPLFDVKWPNRTAEENYLRGEPFHDNEDPHAVPKELKYPLMKVFPDPGPWMKARVTAEDLIAAEAVKKKPVAA